MLDFLKLKSLVIVFIIISLSTLFRLHQIDFPASANEAKEDYTAYSLSRIGLDTNGSPASLFFKADNNYLSTIGVYIKTLVILLDGFNLFNLRLTSVVIGSVNIYLFYLLAGHLLKKITQVLIATILFSFAPLLVASSIFDLGITLALGFVICTSLFIMKKQVGIAYIFAFLAIFADFRALFFVASLLVFVQIRLNRLKIALVILTVLSLCMIISVKITPQFNNYLFRQSILKDLSSENYIAERKLSIGQTQASPLLVGGLNLNRIAYNKYYFTLNQFFKSIIPFSNYERLTSSFLPHVVLDDTTQDKLMKFFIWEIPLAVLGIIFFAKELKAEFKLYLVSSLLAVIFFQEKILLLILPAVIILETVITSSFLNFLNKNLHLLFLIMIAIVLCFNYLIFFDIFWNHAKFWLNQNDSYQEEIWKSLNTNNLSSRSLFVTDQLGEPIFYYLFYNQINPHFFLDNKKLGPLLPAGIQRIDHVGNVNFGSFKYYESDRQPSQIWVGLPGEFEKGKKYNELINNIPDGFIYKKIVNSWSGDNPGSVILFAKTEFEK